MKNNEDKIRAFVSIDIPKRLFSEIQKIQNSLPEFEGKLISPENLHLTLKFLGEINHNVLEEAEKKLQEIKFRCFETYISKIGVFSERYVRIVWLKLEDMHDLQKIVDEKISEIKEFKKENRFMSHLTIARVKSLKNKKYFLSELKKIEIPKNLKFKVRSFHLKKSTLYPPGPVYETLKEFSLSPNL